MQVVGTIDLIIIQYVLLKQKQRLVYKAVHQLNIQVAIPPNECTYYKCCT